jgi:TPR repeat protein
LQRKWALGLYEKQYPGVTLLDAPTVAEENGRFVMTARYSLPKPIEHKDQVYKISYDTRILEGSLEIPAKLARNYPFVPAYGKYRSRYRLTMELPAALRLNVPPVGRQLDSPYLEAHEDYVLRGNLVDYQLDYHVKESRIPASEMPALHETSKKLLEYVSGAFRVREEQLSPPAAAEFSYRDLQLAAMWNGFIEQTKQIAGKKAAEMSVQEACDYAVTFFSIKPALPKSSVAAGEALHALLLSKKMEPQAIECIPSALLAAADGASALSLLVGANLSEDSPLRRELVTARWMTGDLAGAASDMERFYKARSATGQLNAADTLRLVTLIQRAGRPVPDELLATVKRYPRGPWPMPLLAMQSGLLDAADVELIAKSMPADASVMALDDYWFQAGQLALTRNDTVAARKAFGWLKANGIPGQNPRMLAKVELANLAMPDPEAVLAMNILHTGYGDAGMRALRKAAQHGSAAAQYELGIMYRDGLKVPKDAGKAAQLLLAAAKQGHVDAQNEAATCYSLGLGVPADTQRAVDWYREAAANGDDIAMYNLADRYKQGIGMEKDPAAAFALLRASAALGLGIAQGELASFYEQGIGVKADTRQAKFWSSLAKLHTEREKLFRGEMLFADYRGAEKAQVTPGFYQDSGLSGRVERAKALAYYRKGAEQGNGTAMMQLGRMYFYGIGVKQDMAEARTWMTRAHEKQESDATNFLAEMLYYGLGGTADVPAAILMWTANAEQSAESAFNLGQAYNTGTKVAMNRELALKFYDISARQGYGPALNNLGDMHEKGQGVQQNYPKAIEFYKRATQAENRTAFLSLSSVFANGLGVEKDLRIAFVYLALAEQYGFSFFDRDKEHWDLEVKVPADVKKEAKAFASTWTVRTSLPGFSEASASPAGRE